MIKLMAILITGILCSLYMFPFSFTFFPVGNTKIYLAVLGALMFAFDRISKNNGPVVSRTMLNVSLAAIAVSMAGVLSLAYNGATDTTYAQYVILMWVWVGAAYFVVKCIERVHGKVTLEIVALYFIGVCVAQCAFALMNEFIPAFKNIVDAVVEQGTENLNELDRMYGIGASLDTAGSRFACALILLGYLMVKRADDSKRMLAYIVMYLFIVVAGNMVARTTLAGIAISGCYFLYALWQGKSREVSRVFVYFGIMLLVAVPFVGYLYMTSPEVSKLIQFAFEYAFNFFEEGSLETGSTNDLLAMWTYVPTELKTWIIGDGYFMSPYLTNPYYVGSFDVTWGFYMSTDVGYLRFIYYFGLIGLLTFIWFFVRCTRECMKKFPVDKAVFVMLLAMNLILWAKVSTDVFFIFALFLMVDPVPEDTEQSIIEEKESVTA